MGDVSINCPLCCTKTFSSKQSLVEHLSHIHQNFSCPVCKKTVSSVEHLVQHLSVDNCVSLNPTETLIFQIGQESENNEYQSDSNSMEFKPISNAEPHTEPFTPSNLEAADDVNKMYVEFMKPCLQSQEIKLIKEGGESRYMLLTEDPGLADNTILTKQNEDGTISLTVKDMKMESDALITPTKQEPEPSQEELYSCTTCGVSFTSVIDHIKDYHNGQDVVVEGDQHFNNLDDEPDPLSTEYEAVDNEEPTEKQASRRVITDTGDIVETPVVNTSTASEVKPTTQDTTSLLLTELTKELSPTEKPGRGSKRYVQVDKLCDSVVQDLTEPDPKNGPFHRVVVKDVMTTEGIALKMYHCMNCNTFGSALTDFKSQPCKTLKYRCNICTIVYGNAKSLCAHMKVHKTKPAAASVSPETYECEICSTIFPTNKSLKLHKRMHDPIKARPIDPPKNSINAELRYQCNICEKMIPNDYKTIHQNSHENDKMLNCGICNKKFTSAEYLEMHMNVHNLDKVPQNKTDKSLPYSCIYCDRRFARPHEKVKHERIHTGEKPHECEICGKSFRVSYCLTLHMRTHTGARPYACPHCSKRFKAHSVYNHHLLTHSDVRAYKCTFCPKAFKTAVQLAGHKNSHTKPFSCSQCNRPFASLYAVRIHTETHNRQNNLKFSCSLCGASYARAFALKDHVKQVHKQDIDNMDTLPSQDADTSDDWMVKDSADAELLSKDIAQACVRRLDMPTAELIVPN